MQERGSFPYVYCLLTAFLFQMSCFPSYDGLHVVQKVHFLDSPVLNLRSKYSDTVLVCTCIIPMPMFLALPNLFIQVFKKNIYLFIWLLWVLAAACGI